MTNECIVCYSDSAKSICDRCTCNACTDCCKKLTHCPQCRNEFKVLPTLEDLEVISSTIDRLEEDTDFMPTMMNILYQQDVIDELTQDELNILFERFRQNFFKRLREFYAAIQTEVENEN